MELKGKRALVTGGTRGIGAAIAIDFARHGADVVINCREEDDAAQETLGRIHELGVRGAVITADVVKPEENTRLVEEAAAELGGLDVLVHSAGGGTPGNVEDVTPDAWNYTFDVHVHALFHLTRAAMPHLRKSGEGAIVTISSAAGIRGCPGAIAYGTVKGAVKQFTKMLARDVADDNIRVNCVAPGIIRTRFHEKMSTEQQKHNLANRIPLHREGTSEDVAEVVHLLATNEFMTGETVVVDGGMSMQIVR